MRNVIDIEKAKMVLDGEEYSRFYTLYDIYLGCNSIKKYYNRTQLFDDTYEIVKRFDKIASFENYTFLDNEEINKHKVKINLYKIEMDQLLEEIIQKWYSIIHTATGYDVATIKEKIEIMTFENRKSLLEYLEELNNKLLCVEKAKEFMQNNSLKSIKDKVTNITVTIKGFEEKIWNFIWNKRVLAYYSEEQIKEDRKILADKIDRKREWMLCGGVYESSDFEIEKYDLNSLIKEFYLRAEQLSFEEKIEKLYELTEKYFSDLTDSEKSLIRETAHKISREEYLRLASFRNFPDYSKDYDYGLVPEKPIFTLGADGANRYLNSLATVFDEKFNFFPQKHIFIEGLASEIEVCDCKLSSGNLYKTLYISLYGASNPTTAPKGFKII